MRLRPALAVEGGPWWKCTPPGEASSGVRRPRKAATRVPVTDPEPLGDLERDFSQVATALFAPGTLTGTLQEIVDLAERAVDGCDAAGVLLIEHGTATTVAASGPLARELDQLHAEVGEGPCIETAGSGSVYYTADLLDDERWPVFGPAAAASGVRSLLAYCLSRERLFVLYLYARLPAAFGVNDRAQAQLFATMAQLAVASAVERAAEEIRTEHLTDALRTRELIGQAQGILMERERITSDQAFDVLRRASQHMNVKLREIAETLVETGESPTIGEPPPP